MQVYILVLALAGHGALLWGLIHYPLAPDAWLYALVLGAFSVLLGQVGTDLNLGVILGLEATAYYAAILTLGPWAAGLIAILPIYRQAFARGGMSIWWLLRGTGVYALMTIAGGLVYQTLGDLVTPAGGAVPSLLGLALALVTVRLVNEFLLFWATVPAHGLRPALIELRDSQAAAWAVESLAYIPAVLTALFYARLGWDVLLLWLLLLGAAAVALHYLLRARREAAAQLAELSAANSDMSARGARGADVAVRLNRAADELAGYAARLAAALQQQHSVVTGIAATAEELAQQAGTIAEAAGAVDSTSEAALTTAGRGQAAAAGSAAAMASLEHNVREMNARMTALEGRSRLIRRTLGTINNIAGETHLLALNATIEAARAGEQGWRFSVVAQQINGLADQALQAADEIQTTVREIETATADTKEVIEQGLAEMARYTGQVNEARRSMEAILGVVGRASDMAQQIRQATQQQTLASHQVTGAMREITTSLGTASAEGVVVSSAAAELRHLAADLRRLDTEAAHG